MTPFSTPAISEAGKAIALAVAFSALVVYAPLLVLFILPLLPLPLAFLTWRRGVRVGVAGAVCTGALAALLTGPVHGAVALFLAGGVGATLGTGLRRGWRFPAMLFSVMGSVAASLGLQSLIAWVVTGLGWTELRTSFERSLEIANEITRSMGTSEAQLAETTKALDQMLDILPYLLPGIVGASSLLLASASLALAAVIFPRLGQPVAEHLAFARFRLHWSLSYGFIGGLGLIVASRATGDSGDQLYLGGLNVYIFFQTLFFLQGLALVHWLGVSRRLRPSARFLVYALALVGQLTLQITSWAGLFDTWLDYRKRFAPPPAGPQAASANPGTNRDKEE